MAGGLVSLQQPHVLDIDQALALDGTQGIDAFQHGCFLQAFLGESCKMFLEKIASPFWRKLQRPVQSLREPQPATADIG